MCWNISASGRGNSSCANVFRVLRPGGLLRLAVPDLEDIARAYLKTLEETRAGTEGAEKRHQWMLVEILNQLTHTASSKKILA